MFAVKASIPIISPEPDDHLALIDRPPTSAGEWVAELCYASAVLAESQDVTQARRYWTAGFEWEFRRRPFWWDWVPECAPYREDANLPIYAVPCEHGLVKLALTGGEVRAWVV